MMFKDKLKCSLQLENIENDGKFYGANVDELAVKIHSLLCRMAKNDIVRSSFKATIEIVPSCDDESLEIFIKGGAE